MSHPDVDRVTALVRERTGYAVTVLPDPNLAVLSTMKPASPERPAHLVTVNPRHERFLNFLVAQQLLMLLCKWGEGGTVTDFVSTSDRTEFFERKIASQLKGQSLPAPQARQHAHAVTQSLLLRLASAPLLILTGRWCLRDFPGLRQEQELAAAEELRRNSSIFGPEARKQLPDEVFDRGAAMNAAYAVWWSRETGTRQALLPYQATGYEERGRGLADALDGLEADQQGAYSRAVDAWAETLGMVGWYEWRERKA